ncbi:MAG: preprotein translocase subunit SecG [Crocinitomicaceae bacterium]
MVGFLTVLILIACAALILFVLVQNPKGGGLNSEFGSAVQLGGAKRATDILEKGTWGLAIAIAVICLGMAAGGNTVVQTEESVDLEVDASEATTDDENTLPTAPDNGGSNLPIQNPNQ